MGIISEGRKYGLSNHHRGCNKEPLQTSKNPHPEIGTKQGFASLAMPRVKAVQGCVTFTLLLEGGAVLPTHRLAPGCC